MILPSEEVRAPLIQLAALQGKPVSPSERFFFTYALTELSFRRFPISGNCMISSP